MNAELLLMFTLGCDRPYLYAHPERELTLDEHSRFSEALAERSRGVPAQYITGHQEFWGMDFIVTPAVLIPRPETEHVIETVLEFVAGIPTSDIPLQIVDVGTGSGCIALALAKELPKAEIHATDISPSALGVARINAARNQLETRVHFRETDLLAGFPSDSFDFVVSNPPYVADSDFPNLQREVRDHEPRVALTSGDDGLSMIRKLLNESPPFLVAGGHLVLEIGYNQRSAVEQLADARVWRVVTVRNDLQGIPRTLALQKLGHNLSTN